MKKVISYLLALAMLFGIMPVSVFADGTPVPDPMTLTVSIAGKPLVLGEGEKDGYVYYGFKYAPEDPAADEYGYIYPKNTATLYTVEIPNDTEVLDFSLSRSGLLYNYDGYGQYLSGWYEDGGIVGVTSAAISVDADSDGRYDFIQVQNTYDPDWTGGELLFAVTFKGEKNAAQASERKDDLLGGIASGYSSSTDAWTILDMAAYNGSNIKGDGYGTSSAAPKALACAALGEEISGLDDVKTAGAFGIYTVPYLALAYRASGSFGEGDHSEESLKAAMLGYLNSLTASDVDPDCIAPVICGLAPYYKTDEAIKASVDGAIDLLSGAQNIDGSFSESWTKKPNANSTALVIAALSSLGIDAATDSRFVKAGGSALSGLMAFALENNTGFGYTNNLSLNSMATEQGFRALVSYANMISKGDAYNIYLEAKAAGNEPVIPHQKQEQKDIDDTIAVSLAVKGHGGRADFADRTVELRAGASVRDALDLTGLEIKGDSYVSAIDGLSEFDWGEKSGWMYKVNGVSPEVGAAEYILKNGDTVVWYYTVDWTQEENAVKHEGEREDIPADAVGTEFSDVPADAYFTPAVAWAVSNGVAAGVGNDKFGVGSDCTREQMITFLWNLAGKPEAGGESFSDVKGVTYCESAIIWAKSLGIAAGKGDGSFGVGEIVTREQVVTFLWNYAGRPESVGSAAFSDVPADAYYAKAVAWANEKGITAGVGDGLFGSGRACTREQVITLMYKCFAEE